MATVTSVFEVKSTARLPGGDKVVTTVRKIRRNVDGVNRAVKKVGRNTGFLQMARRADLVNRSVTRLRTGLAGLAVGGVIGAAVGTAVNYLAKLNDEFKLTELNLARTIGVLTGANFDLSLQAAPELQRKLSRAAASTPGNDQEFVSTFSKLAVFGPSLGLSIDQLTSLSQKTLVGGQLAGNRVGRQTAGTDVVQALTTTVGDRLTPVVASLLRQAGIDQDVFNGKDIRGRFKLLTEAMDGLAPVVDALNSTFQARTTTLESQLKILTNAYTKSFTQGVSDNIGKVSGFLDGNMDRLLAIGEGLQPLVSVLLSVGTVGGVATGVLASIAGVLTAVIAIAGTTLGGFTAGASILVALPAVVAVIGALGAVSAVAAAGAGALVAAMFALPGLTTRLGFAFEAILFEIVQIMDPLWKLGSILVDIFGPAVVFVGRLVGNVLVTQMEMAARSIRFAGEMLKAFGATVEGVAFLASAALKSLARDMRGSAKDEIRGHAKLIQSTKISANAVKDFGKPLQGFDMEPGAYLEALAAMMKPADNTVKTGDIVLNIQTDTIEDPQIMATVMNQALAEINSRRSQAKRLRRSDDL